MDSQTNLTDAARDMKRSLRAIYEVLKLLLLRVFGKMELYEIIPGKLYQSPAIIDWREIPPAVDVVFSLANIDSNIPDHLTYVHWPIVDGPLPPDLDVLEAFALIGADLIDKGHVVLSHCGAGINRASLMNGEILRHMGAVPVEQIVSYIREHRPGALTNEAFVKYLSRPECTLYTIEGE